VEVSGSLGRAFPNSVDTFAFLRGLDPIGHLLLAFPFGCTFESDKPGMLSSALEKIKKFLLALLSLVEFGALVVMPEGKYSQSHEVSL